VTRRPSKEHTEDSSKSVHPWSATSKTKQAHVTCSHPAEPWIHSRAATTVQRMSRWKGDGPGGAHGGVGVGGHSRAENVAWNVRVSSRSAHARDVSTERVGSRGKGKEPQWDETERGRGG